MHGSEVVIEPSLGVIADPPSTAHVGAQFVHLSERPFGSPQIRPSNVVYAMLQGTSSGYASAMLRACHGVFSEGSKALATVFQSSPRSIFVDL
jgi:hypothetical protein